MTNDPHATGAMVRAGVPPAEASLGVVLLHGRGSSARDILSLAPHLDVPGAAYVAPEAVGHTWYPLSFLAPREANEPYLSSALRRVEAAVKTLEDAGVAARRIVIAGFSQGACLATEFVASHGTRNGALIAFTGGLIGPPGSVEARLGRSTGRELEGMPALLLSGDPDPHVPWQRVEDSAALLREMGATAATRRFPGRPHTITQEELSLAREVLLNLHPS